MTIHDLKIWPEFFEAVREGSKTFEYRFDDRGFGAGDVLRLEEWDERLADRPSCGYTGRSLLMVVTYILSGLNMGIPEGYVIMSIKPYGGEVTKA